VEHQGSLSSSIAPWRTAALVAAALAAIELVLLVVIGLAFAAKPFADEAAQATRGRTGNAPVSAPQEKAAAGSAVLSRGETSVLVLNGNGLQGAAAIAAGRVRAKGYLIAGTSNARRSDFRRSLVMYRPGYRGEAERLAKDVDVTRVSPLDGLRAGELQGAHAVLIVGTS
jgi:hypothetical protein